MANNRMFLVHIPTGLAVGIAKSMGYGWYLGENKKLTIGDNVEKLFEVLEKDFSYGCEPNNFAIAMENAAGASTATDAWQYGESRSDGLVQLIMVHNA